MWHRLPLPLKLRVVSVTRDNVFSLCSIPLSGCPLEIVRYEEATQGDEISKDYIHWVVFHKVGMQYFVFYLVLSFLF